MDKNTILNLHNDEHIFKILILGDSNIGKTQMVTYLIKQIIYQTNYPTIGIDLSIKKYTLDINSNLTYNVKLHIWDTSGNDKFKHIIRSYYDNCHIALIMFQLNNLESFNNLNKWIIEIKNYGSSTIKIIIIGNNCDNCDNIITKKMINNFILLNNLSYFEICCSNGDNINRLFYNLSKNLLRKKLNLFELKYELQNYNNKNIELISNCKKKNFLNFCCC